MNEENKKVNRIGELRKEKGLSQGELAKKTNLTRQAISLYEIGKRKPSISVIRGLASFFNVTTAYLMGLSDDRNGWKAVEQYTGMPKQDMSSGEFDERTAKRINDDILHLGSRTEIYDYLSLLLIIDTGLAHNEEASEDDKKLAHQLLDNLLNKDN